MRVGVAGVRVNMLDLGLRSFEITTVRVRMAVRVTAVRVSVICKAFRQFRLHIHTANRAYRGRGRVRRCWREVQQIQQRRRFEGS